MKKPSSVPLVGKLAVDLTSDSVFFGASAPVEVRDAEMRLVKQTAGGRDLSLPAGLYQVSAVLQDGQKHATLVQVKAGERARVRLGGDPGAPGARTPDLARWMRDAAPGTTFKGADQDRKPGPAGADVTASLDELRGARFVGRSGPMWLLEHAGPANQVPTVRVAAGERSWSLSLPISEEGGFPSNTCCVHVVQTSSGPHVHAWILPARTVANALQNMLASRYLVEAAKVAENAVDLLRDKYQDPTGAALGALLLYKTGRLPRWRSWVENLARDFPWLPDGKILLAQLLWEDEVDRERAIDLAILASRQRVLFAESYSLLLELLRRSVDEADPRLPEWKAALRGAASGSSDIDWDSICLSVGASGPDEGLD